MDDRLKESISALMDDEANELELQRVLSLKDSDSDELRSVWQSYHSIREVVSEDRGHSFSIDISAAVSDAIRSEEEHSGSGVSEDQPVSEVLAEQADYEQAPVTTTKRKFKVWYAAAASVALAVLFTAQSGLNTNKLHVPSVAVNDQVRDDGTVKVNRGNVDQDGQSESPVIMAQLDESQARQLSRYLLRHAEHSVRGTQSGFVPLARIASVNSVGI